MGNKQKIIKLIRNYLDDPDKETEDLADEIDAMYNRDCGKCKHFPNMAWCESCRWANDADYYEEADK